MSGEKKLSVVDFRKQLDEEVIAGIEQALERARKGEVLGFVLFTIAKRSDGMPGTAYYEGGDKTMGSYLHSIEHWKWDRMAAQRAEFFENGDLDE